MNDELDENIAWADFVKGDKKSFEFIYNSYYGPLLNYATKFDLDLWFIEEAIQDLFVKLWKNRANLNQPGSIKFYLFRALKNCIYNKIKISHREVYIGDESDMLAFDLHFHPVYHEGQDSDQLIKKLLEPLTERQKEAIYLFYVEDMGYKEIADLLKIKIGGAYKLIYRALAGIREQAKDLDVAHKVADLPAKMRF